jgi:hypothetical protein
MHKLDNGLYIKDAKQNICMAIRIKGSGSFNGPCKQIFENDAVIIKDMNSEVRLIQPDVFINTYVDENGISFDSLERLPTYCVKTGVFF